MSRKPDDNEEKKYDIEKLFRNPIQGKPLCVHENDKDYYVEYDVETYCEIIKDIAKSSSNSGTKAELLEDIYKEIYKEIEPTADKSTEACSKYLNRINCRLTKGMEKENENVASDKVCYDFLKTVEDYVEKSKSPDSIFKYKAKKIYTKVQNEEPYSHGNYHIYKPIVHLIDDMYASHLFNYLPNSSDHDNKNAYKVYRNELEMIEKNIDVIFAENDELLKKWKEIIKPIQRIIYNGDYPGFREGDIWLEKCNELRYFDCSYSITEVFREYQEIKKKLIFDLGDNIVKFKNVEIKNKGDFMSKGDEDEESLFCFYFQQTFKKIVEDVFGL